MNERQEQLLVVVINSHIATAEPVGSKFLVSEGLVDYGEATVRNELRELEEMGFLTHPHTSAGRVPTEKGYRYFIEKLDLAEAKISKKDNDLFGMSMKGAVGDEQKEKGLARVLSELSNETVLVAFSPDHIYFTGLSNLFSKPEFNELKQIATISQVFDHCEQCLVDFYEQTDEEVKYFIGPEHDFGNMLSVAAFRFGEEGLLALLGPLRMDYMRNYSLLKKVQELL